VLTPSRRMGAGGIDNVQTASMRVEIHVRPNASTCSVGGDFDGALIVRVVEPADGGRATEAALRAVAAAIDLPRRSVTLFSGFKNRRKLVEIQTSSVDARRIQSVLDRLRCSVPD
jgi:uncharacterized protein YggU (UPF0235/DUF167 family)